jgi:amidase
MHPFDPTAPFASATEMADAVRQGRTSATALVVQAFDRIERYNPSLNAIVWQDRERATRRAREADEAVARGGSLGALHGVPITIKESFAYEGSPNTWGVPVLARVDSPRTAIAVDRLESAGAIIVGKTNVPAMLGDWQTFNPVYGATNNPWDLNRTPGGSTGGGAAAVAAGLGALAVGSDLAGSLRIPAHFCGIYGHKPSLDLVSMAGFQPGPWDGSPGYPMDLSVAGPLARSAVDLELALRVLGGPNGDEAKAWTWTPPAPRHARLRDYRIGYVLADRRCPVSSDVAAVYASVLADLSKTGATLEEGWPAAVDLDLLTTTYSFLLLALVTVDAGARERELARRRFAEDPHDMRAAALVEPHARWLQETQRRLAFRTVWQKYFESHDVFLMPTTFTAAFPHDHSDMAQRVIDTPEGGRPYSDVAFWIGVASLAGLPATVAPVGVTAAGLPVGLQIVAPMWEDATAIAFAAQLADVAVGFTPPSGLA